MSCYTTKKWLPPNILVAHKTGEWDPYYHDGGIVYKPSAPFVFVGMSKSGSATVIAKMAEIAYYQSANVVGYLNDTTSQPIVQQNRPTYSLSNADTAEAVLGASTTDTPNPVTADDLGITQNDLGVNPDFADVVKPALITDSSPFFFLKKIVQTVKENSAKTNDDKIRTNIDFAKDALSQLKTALSQDNLSQTDRLLQYSENYLKKAADLTQNTTNPLYETEIKQLSNLRFSLLAQASKHNTPKNKDQFVDTVYSFYSSYTKTLQPYIAKNSANTTPSSQKPIIGTIQTISGTSATVQLTDGSVRKVILPDMTPVRTFQSETVQSTASLKQGTQIAIVGTVTDSTIVPQFVMQNIPRSPQQIQNSVVVAINPNSKTITVINGQGNQQIITVDDNTKLKSKDTNVSLEGIKIGSQISVYGVTVPAPLPSPSITIRPTGQVTASPSALQFMSPTVFPPYTSSPAKSISGIIIPTPTLLPTVYITITTIPAQKVLPSPVIKAISAAPIPTKKSSTPLSITQNKKNPTPAPTNISNNIIHATSITVTKNSSGKKEIIIKK